MSANTVSISQVLFRFRYQVLLMTLLFIGGLVVQNIIEDAEEAENQGRLIELRRAHSETVVRIETAMDIYSTIVSSIRAYLQSQESFPSEPQLQKYLMSLFKESEFKDSIVVSLVDTNQIFKYSVTPYQIDPSHLDGINVKTLRPANEIRMLDSIMKVDSIVLFPPINLVEGWAAFPFNFSARNSKGEILGYIATVLNVKYFLNYAYSGGRDSMFIKSFTVNGTTDLTRESVFDGTRIYNKSSDKEYYKNFNLKDSDYLYSELDFHGLKLRVGTAYKNPQVKGGYHLIEYLWFLSLAIFLIITIIQLVKNHKVNLQLVSAKEEITQKNLMLEKNLEQIRTLLKEVHHRVKNNMQIISSLLNLQANEEKNKGVSDVLHTSKLRIQSMALVHQKLYGNEDLTTIDVNDYCRNLITYIEGSYNTKNLKVDKTFDIPRNLHLNIDVVVPLGLIINELLTNSYKYAFTGSSSGCIEIRMKYDEHESMYTLIYSDSGQGIPEEIDIYNTGTLGLELINILAQQLGGKVSYFRIPRSTFEIRFRG